MTYTRTVNGTVYQFTEDDHTDAEFSETTDTTVVKDEFRTVARWDLSRGEGVAFGVGTSRNPDRAEGYLYFDAQNSGASAIDGQLRLVVENTQNERVATIYKRSLKQLRSGSTAPADREKRVPFPYQALMNGKGEVLHPYQIAIQLKLPSSASSTETFSLSDSELLADGYSGSAQN